jgi:hypothetical protein
MWTLLVPDEDICEPADCVMLNALADDGAAFDVSRRHQLCIAVARSRDLHAEESMVPVWGAQEGDAVWTAIRHAYSPTRLEDVCAEVCRIRDSALFWQHLCWERMWWAKHLIACNQHT